MPYYPKKMKFCKILSHWTEHCSQCIESPDQKKLWITKIVQNCDSSGSGCGSVGRAVVASDTIGRYSVSSNRIFENFDFLSAILKKRSGNGQFLKNWNCSQWPIVGRYLVYFISLLQLLLFFTFSWKEYCKSFFTFSKRNIFGLFAFILSKLDLPV